MYDVDSHDIGLPGFGRLTLAQINRLHEAGLQVLERTGVRFFDDEALDLFRKGGATVDGNLVRIRPHLVEWALRTAPKNIVIYDQNGERAMELGGYRVHYGPGSDCRHIYDLDTGIRREATLNDVQQAVKMVDALPHIDFVMSMYMPTDVPTGTHEPRQMAIMLQNTTKPITFVSESMENNVCAVEMAAAVAGDIQLLAQKPFVISYAQTVDPFTHSQEGVQRMMYNAKNNIPTIYSPGIARGTLTPLTPAGAVALASAGQLAGLVLAQLKREGAPIIRTNPGGEYMDLRTMITLYCYPDSGPFPWDLTHSQGLPTFGVGGCSDAKIFDAQATSEATLNLFTHALGGCSLVHDIGYLDAAMTGSMELVAFSDEVISWLKRYLRPAEINEESLALDEIDAIGPDGAFLESKQTLAHLRDDWQPTLFDRFDYDRWSNRGATTLEQRANKKVKDILASHQPTPLPENIIEKINSILNMHI